MIYDQKNRVAETSQQFTRPFFLLPRLTADHISYPYLTLGVASHWVLTNGAWAEMMCASTFLSSYIWSSMFSSLMWIEVDNHSHIGYHLAKMVESQSQKDHLKESHWLTRNINWIVLSTRNKHSVEPLKIWKKIVTIASTILINRLVKWLLEQI